MLWPCLLKLTLVNLTLGERKGRRQQQPVHEVWESVPEKKRYANACVTVVVVVG